MLKQSLVLALLLFAAPAFSESRHCRHHHDCPSSSSSSSSSGGGSSSGSSSSSSSSSSSGGSSGSGTLIGFLQANTGSKILVGQHSSYWTSNPLDYEQQIVAATGQATAILGVTTSINGSTENAVSVSNAWLATGGIVLLSWWPPDPITGQTGESNPQSAANFASLTVPGTAGYIAWHKELDTQIAQLKQINGTVIYRPLLEMNGNWDWWGRQNTATFQLLWQQMHDYFAAQGVTNVLWFYCPDGDGEGNYMAYYPGSGYVDVAGADEYTPTPGSGMVSDGSYSQFVSTGKPIIIGEAGCSTASASTLPVDVCNYDSYFQSLRTYAPQVVAFVAWCQGDGIPRQNGMAALMAEPMGVNRAALPPGLH